MSGGDDGITRERQRKMAAAARSLERTFEGHGFALLVFDTPPREGRVGYASNRGRGDVLDAMRRFIAANGPGLTAADHEALNHLARRALAHPMDPRLLPHPVQGPEARRVLATLRVTVQGVLVAFSLDLTPPAWEPVRHLSVGATDGAPPGPAFLDEVARVFGMEGCRFEAPPPPHGGGTLHAFRPLRDGAAAAMAVASDDRPRWTN